MIDVKTAVQTADAYLHSFPNLLEVVAPRLEETDIDQKTGDWLITVSFLEHPDSLGTALSSNPPRTYRQVRINRDSGEVVSMKFRNPLLV